VAVVGYLSIMVVCLFCFVMSRKISATALLVPLESPQWVSALSLGDKKTRQCKSYKRILLEKRSPKLPYFWGITIWKSSYSADSF
jgi:hypothetical protein